jgi:hypothetical protein
MAKLDLKLELLSDMCAKSSKILIISRLPITLLTDEIMCYLDIRDICRLLPIYYTRNQIIIILQIINSLPIESYDEFEEIVSFIRNFREMFCNFDQYNKFDIAKYVKYLNKQKIQILDILRTITSIKLMEIDYESLNNYMKQLCLAEETIRDCENSMQETATSQCDSIRKPSKKLSKEYTLEVNQEFTKKISTRLSSFVEILFSYRILKVLSDLSIILQNIKDAQTAKEFVDYYEQHNKFQFFDYYDEISNDERLDDEEIPKQVPYYIKFTRGIDKRIPLVNPNFTIADPNALDVDFPTDAFNRFDFYYKLIKMYLNLPYIQDDCSYVHKFVFVIEDQKTLDFNLLSISKIIYKQKHLQHITHERMLEIGKKVINYCKKELSIGQKLIKGEKLKDGKLIEFIMYPNTKEVYNTIVRCLEQIVC